jgi:hypothetical protein
MADRLADVVRRLALRPDGFCTTDAELEPFGRPSQIGRNMSYLVRNGAIISVRLSSKSAIYFGQREWADAWIARANHAPWERRCIKGNGAELQHREPLRGEAVLAPDFKFTACPSYMPRFQPVVVPGAPRVYHGAVGRVQ